MNRIILWSSFILWMIAVQKYLAEDMQGGVSQENKFESQYFN